MNAWSDLPNSKHIDAVIASLKANPDKWVEVWDKAGGWTEARIKARNAAWNAMHNAARLEVVEAARNAAGFEVVNAAQDAVWNVAGKVIRVVERAAARVAAWNAARGAILALIAYDDCAHLLTTNPKHVKMMAEIGNEAAILLYPASLVFSEIKNERNPRDHNLEHTWYF